MKVFVPVSDAALAENGEICRRLVPFDSSFLTEVRVSRQESKPDNWISDCDTEQARRRLDPGLVEPAGAV